MRGKKARQDMNQEDTRDVLAAMETDLNTLNHGQSLYKLRGRMKNSVGQRWTKDWDFPGGTSGKESACNAGDTGEMCV